MTSRFLGWRRRTRNRISSSRFDPTPLLQRRWRQRRCRRMMSLGVTVEIYSGVSSVSLSSVVLCCVYVCQKKLIIIILLKKSHQTLRHFMDSHGSTKDYYLFVWRVSVILYSADYLCQNNMSQVENNYIICVCDYQFFCGPKSVLLQMRSSQNIPCGITSRFTTLRISSMTLCTIYLPMGMYICVNPRVAAKSKYICIYTISQQSYPPYHHYNNPPPQSINQTLIQTNKNHYNHA